MPENVRYELTQPQYLEFLTNIQNYFDANENTIHKARNILKTIEHKDKELVVKSFQVPNLLRRIIYTFFRDSKAKKSYEYALKIQPFTPKPIGYVEFYQSSLLKRSFFVAEKFDYDFTIREPLLDSSFFEREKIFKAFAKFTYQLHERGILHKDYSPGNILVKRQNNSYLFQIVDINRMEFKTLSFYERMANFDKLWARNEDLEIIVKEYARVAKIDEKSAVKTALKASQKLKKRKNFKKRLKGKPVND